MMTPIILAALAYVPAHVVQPRVRLAGVSSPTRLRGGAVEASALANYAGEAAALFGNMGGAAAFLAGGLVPLTTFAAPTPSPDDSQEMKRMKRSYEFMGFTGISSLLISIIYATMSNNKLKETAVAATVSLKALLIEGDYALPWVGCNVHFILGLISFAATAGLNIWIKYGGVVGKAVICSAAAASAMILSIVNDAVAAKGPTGIRVGGSFLNLFSKYVSLLVSSVVSAGALRPLLFVSLALFAASAFYTAKALFKPDDDL